MREGVYYVHIKKKHALQIKKQQCFFIWYMKYFSWESDFSLFLGPVMFMLNLESTKSFL